MGKDETDEISGITIKSIVVGTIFALFAIWINTPALSVYWIGYTPMNEGMNVYSDRQISCYGLPPFLSGLGVAVFACIIMLVVNAARSGTFSMQEATIIFAMIFGAGFLSIGGYYYGMGDKCQPVSDWSIGIIKYIKDPAKQDTLFGLLPSLWPGKEVAEAHLTNVVEPFTGVWGVNWSYWSNIFGWRWVFNLGCVFLFIGIVTLLRRQYVEVESLPFPHAEVFTEVVKTSQSGKNIGNLFMNKWFIIAFVIQTVWSIIPMGPSILTNRGLTSGYDHWLYLVPLRQIKGTWGDFYRAVLSAGSFCYNAWPFWIGFCYLWPMAELGGGLVGVGIAWGWALIALSMGVQGTLPGTAIGDRGSTFGNPAHMLLMNWDGVIFGFLLALVIIPAIRHRKLVIQSLKGIYTKQDDSTKITSYRTGWLILIAGFVLLIIAGAMIGLTIGAWIIFLVLSSIVALAFLRVTAANGGAFLTFYRAYTHGGGWFTTIAIPIMLLFGLTEPNPTNLQNWWWMVLGDSDAKILWTGIAAGILLLAFYKTGKLTKTKEKGILIGGAIGLSLAAIFGVVFYAMIQQFLATTSSYSNGSIANTLNTYWTKFTTIGALDTFASKNRHGIHLVQSPEYFVAATVLGFAVLAAFSLLRRRYSWFIVSATGVLSGASWGSLMWMPLLLGIILKYLTLRVGGSQKYEQIGKPLAVGFIVGAAFAFFIHTLIVYYNGVLLFGVS